MNNLTYGVDLAISTVEPVQTEAENERKLQSEIQVLWAAHQTGKTTARRTKDELKILRVDLGGKLFELKAVLVRTGRSGGWAAYLRSQGLARATVERYISQHEHVMSPGQIDSPETISEPSEEAVRRLVRRLMPQFRRVLKTPAWLEWFTVEVEYQWKALDASSTNGRLDEAGPVPRGNSGGSHNTDVVLLSDAA
jgi:hypothetical protein